MGYKFQSVFPEIESKRRVFIASEHSAQTKFSILIVYNFHRVNEVMLMMMMMFHTSSMKYLSVINQIWIRWPTRINRSGNFITSIKRFVEYLNQTVDCALVFHVFVCIVEPYTLECLCPLCVRAVRCERIQVKPNHVNPFKLSFRLLFLP